tara:strand:+ start:468 stop:677 length:210 start_codon:yes stop_codon:yes gene_type:complete
MTTSPTPTDIICRWLDSRLAMAEAEETRIEMADNMAYSNPKTLDTIRALRETQRVLSRERAHLTPPDAA